ncbi:DeoR/GlpR family DNA-binding transcription regulator [Ectobacillus ponti]|uniref:DeoR/GlpR family DNA-binding transcription regulator n=1 Tax=Ectobacillus ponti TaxID=2961894 RepID=A0AA41X7J6_9BACI|nr:DeoR/GlpR family DNA-binding transcription regulator [Ectobacillus ponti]MCP8967733.1 DeoR/GlpR family DNA-binding transcription regulator [Ectobacillus ponti]
MLMAERHQKIIELVNRQMSVRVSELSRLFSVTEETIRRDLEKLEKDGRLQRSHGGAVSLQQESREVEFSQREITSVHEKKAIAYQAVSLIEPGDRIILDASSTAWYVAKAIPDMPLTVITNSIQVAIELSKKEHVQVISLGGNLLPASLSYAGPLAERSLKHYHVNKLFLSCQGVHLESGLSDSHELQALLKRRMMEAADMTILMADSSKFGVRTFAHIAPIHKVQRIITDDGLQPHVRQELQERGLQVTMAGV